MKSYSQLNKENILKQKDTYELLNYYLQPYHNRGLLKQGRHISNPFLSEKQKTPSFNIYKNASGDWRYKDFAIPDCEGTVFDLVMKLNGCSFSEALQRINLDFNLGLGKDNSTTVAQKQPNIQFYPEWNEQNAAYWKSYGILPEHLNHFKVFPVEKVTRYGKDDKPFYIQATPQNPIFAYQVEGDCYKLYQPLFKKFKFLWVGNKSENYTFGYSVLPKTGEQLFITGGEKDVISLFAHGYRAICFNSETALPHPDLMRELKERFERIIVLYDMDETGKAQSKKLAETFQLYRATLPTLDGKMEKDVSDLFKSGKTLSDDTAKVFAPSQPKAKKRGKHLEKLVKVSQELCKIIATEIQEIPSLLKRNGEGVVFAQSIHLIHGKTGTHKSRLAQTISSALLKEEACTHDLLGMQRNPDIPCCVCYVDTERNLKGQFPKALQDIQLDAGLPITEKPKHFHYTSLVEIPRGERFGALCEYMDYIQEQIKDEHLVVVLDVVSDCVLDFNSTQDSLLLIDKLNNEINKREKQVSFIAVIHENPGITETKPRGHLGSEMGNKATFTFRTAFENAKQQEPSDVLLIQFPKNRNGRKPPMVVAEFCETTKRLVVTDTPIPAYNNLSNKKGNLGEIMEFLSSYVTGKVTGKTLIDDLCQTFSCGHRTIRERLKELCNNYFEIPDANKVPCQLVKTQIGREVFYHLQPIEQPTSAL